GRRRNRGGGGGGASSQVKNGVGGTGTHAITEDVRNALARVASVTVNHDSTVDGDQPAAAASDAPAPVVTGVAPVSTPAAAEPAEATWPVAILDIPVAKQPRQKRAISPKAAEQIL